MAEEPAVVEPPVLLAGKYKTQADLEQGYLELQTKMGAQATPAPAPIAAAPPATPATPAAIAPGGLSIGAAAAPTTIVGALAAAGVTAAQVTQEWAANGNQLTPESYAKFNAVGLPELAVNTTMEGMMMKAQAQSGLLVRSRAQSVNVAGGEAQLQNLLTWSSSLAPHEQAEMNQRLSDPNQMVGAVYDLQERFQQAAGVPGTQPLAGGSAGAPTPTSHQAYESEEFGTVIQNAMNNGGKVTQEELARIGATPMSAIQDRSR